MSKMKNFITRVVLIVGAILLLFGCSQQIYAQRCGGGVQYVVRDESGAIKDPEKAELKVVRVGSKEYETTNSVGGSDSLKTVFIHTRCGLSLAEVTLKIASRVMLLRFHNLPAEIDFFVDSLSFQEGTFEIDFKGDMGLRSLELNREGLRDKEGKLLLSGTAEAGLLVSANNWKRTAAQ